MSKVIYIAGASQKEYALNSGYEVNIKQCDPYAAEWSCNMATLGMGEVITDFSRKAIALELTMKLRGKLEDISLNIENLISESERDILEHKEGRLYVGEYYLLGYFVKKSHAPSEEWMGREMILTFLAPSAFWLKDDVYYIPSSEVNTGSIGFDNSHYADSHFILETVGSFDAFEILLNGNTYRVNVNCGESEYIVVNSRTESIYLYSGGVLSNIYHLQDFNCDNFKKIPPGRIEISYDRSFGIFLNVCKERVMPKWLPAKKKGNTVLLAEEGNVITTEDGYWILMEG